jgi:hypothetical protein
LELLAAKLQPPQAALLAHQAKHSINPDLEQHVKAA